jgi:hypothetical protein
LKSAKTIAERNIQQGTMMNKKRFLELGVLLAFGTIFTPGCKKFVYQNIKAASNSSLAVLTYDDIFKQINASVSSEIALDEMTSGTWNINDSVCATVMLEPIGPAFPKTLVIDYGSGCIGPDGISRSGKIIAMFDGNFRTEGTSVLVSFEGYTGGQYMVSGTDSIYNNGVDGSGNPLFNHTIANGTISWGGQNVTWDASLKRTWLEGNTTNYTTPDSTSTMGMAGLNDDIFELKVDTSSGNDGDGSLYSWATNSPIQVQTGCEFIQSGTATVSLVNYHEGLIDYGNGDCDSHATIEINGEVFNFTM